MSDPTDAFTDKPKTNPGEATPPTTAQSTDPFADRLMQIKNERGEPKYDSVEKALEALQHSQTYIPDLKSKLTSYEQELEQLRNELATRQSVEDVVSRLTAGNDQGKPNADGTPPEVKGLDEQAAKQLFEQMLTENKNKETFQSNRQKVNSALAERYGEKVADVVAEKAKELGTSPTQLGELASQNPNLVLALFNTQASKGASPTTSSLNIPSSNKPNEAPLEKPKKSLLSGATSKEQAEYMRAVRDAVYKRHGIDPA